MTLGVIGVCPGGPGGGKIDSFKVVGTDLVLKDGAGTEFKVPLASLGGSGGPATPDLNVTGFAVVGNDLELKDEDGSIFKVPLTSLIKLTKADGTPFDPLVDRIGGIPNFATAPTAPAAAGMFMINSAGQKVAIAQEVSSTGILLPRWYLA